MGGPSTAQWTRRTVREVRTWGARPIDITTPAVAASAAAMTSAVLTASVTSSAPVAAGSAAMTGITASPARLAARATALLTPEPVLTWSGSVAAITVAVSGAT